MEFVLNEYHRNVSDEELLGDILRVAIEIGKKTITIKEYIDHGGKYDHSTISRRFGGWVKALQLCGLSPTNTQITSGGISEESLINDLILVSEKIKKKTFTTTEYYQFGKYSRDSFFRKFGSWNGALKAANLEPFDHPLGGGTKNKVSEYSCFEEIERIWINLGRQPTSTDIKNGVSKYSLHVFERRFGSWRKALESFVEYINGEQRIEESEEERISQPQDISPGNINKKGPIHKTTRDIGLRLRFMVMKRDNFKCCICGRSPATNPGLELHIDHIIPWSKGGETVIDNLQTLCSDCNLGKGNLLENNEMN